MSDRLTIMLALAFTVAVYVVVMWANVVINRVADQIRSGIVEGMPLRKKERWLLLYTNWLGYTAFVVTLLLLSALGLVAFVQDAQARRVEQVGYMCATFLAGGAVFITVLGSFHFSSCRSAILSDQD